MIHWLFLSRLRWLVGGFEHEFYFSILIGNVIIPSDELIFFGVGTTSWDLLKKIILITSEVPKFFNPPAQKPNFLSIRTCPEKKLSGFDAIFDKGWHDEDGAAQLERPAGCGFATSTRRNDMLPDGDFFCVKIGYPLVLQLSWDWGFIWVLWEWWSTYHWKIDSGKD